MVGMLINGNKNELVNQAISGDRHALNQLIRQSYTLITAQIQRQVNDFTVVHDLAQEVCIKLFRHIKRFDKRASFTTWLYRIIQNTVKNYYRANSRACSEGDVTLEHTHNSCPVSELIGMQLSKRLDATFIRLPEKMRTCFMLYAVTGLSYEDISLDQRCSLGTVRSRIHRTRDILRASIK